MSGVWLYFVGYSAANGSLCASNGQNRAQYMNRKEWPCDELKPLDSRQEKVQNAQRNEVKKWFLLHGPLA